MLRSLMEVGIVAGLGYWGFHTGNGTAKKIILSIVSPAIIFGFWGLFDFHNVRNFSEILRLIQELILSWIAAAALYFAGQHTFGWILSIISIIHHLVVYSIGDTLLK
jgi:hypothetical protein